MAGHGAAPGERRGGRAKGTPNQRTRDLVAILDAAGYCPVADYIWAAGVARKEYDRCDLIYAAIEDKKALAGNQTPTQDMAPTYIKIIQDSAAGVMPYLYPKRKAIEFNDPNGTAANTLTEIFKRIADRK